MGFNTGVINDVWIGLFPEAFQTLGEQPYLALPNPNPARKRVWVCDIASWLYLRTSPFTLSVDGVLAHTFGDWLDQARARIENYLKDISVQRVVLMLDSYSDPAKRYLRDKKNQPKVNSEGIVIKKASPVPETPPEGFRQFLIRESRRYHDLQKNSLPESPDGDLRDIDIVLPGDWPGSQYNFASYLSNSEFKNHFFIPLVCRNLHIGLRVPYGKEVLIRGPNTALLVRSDGPVAGQLPNELRVPIGEPDCMVGYWMKVWPECDYLVDSEDGDVLTNLLLTSSLRQRPRHSQAEVLKPEEIFKNRVTLMRNQWDRTHPKNMVIDINRLWTDMFQHSSAMNSANIAQLRNPIADQVLLAYLSGNNDFIDGGLLPKIGPVRIFTTYLNYLKAFPNGLTLPHLTNGRYTGFFVDMAALCAFVIYAHKTIYANIELDHTDAEKSFATIRKQMAKLDIPRVPDIKTVRQLAVQLTWTLNYYANGCYGTAIPRSFERINKLSKYGWERISESGAVVPTRRVDSHWLLDITHPNWRPKEPTTTFAFVAPQPDRYNQLDPILSNS